MSYIPSKVELSTETNDLVRVAEWSGKSDVACEAVRLRNMIDKLTDEDKVRDLLAAYQLKEELRKKL